MIEPGLVQSLREFFAARSEEIAAAYLFGSHARGDAGAASDVDVAVLLEEEPPPTFDGLRLDLGAALEGLLGRPVDLVVLDRASPDLVHRVLRDGYLLAENDPARRVRFEVLARNAYFDLLPVLREYRRETSPDR